MRKIQSAVVYATLVIAGLEACEFPDYNFAESATKLADAAELDAPTEATFPDRDAANDNELPGSGNGNGESDAAPDSGTLDADVGCAADHGNATCNGAPCASCLELKQTHSCAPSGTYLIDPDRDGALAAFDVHCDMKFGGGGWTLLLSTQPPDGPQLLAIKTVLPGASAFMAPVQMQAIANDAVQVHVRTSGKAESESITSVRNSRPIHNLRALKILNAGIPVDDEEAQLAVWTGPLAKAELLRFRCFPNDTAYPNSYEACGESGLFLSGRHSRWSWADGDTSLNQALEMYIR